MSMLPSQFFHMLFSSQHLLPLRLADKLRRLDRVNHIVFRLFDADLPLHPAVLVAVGKAVIMPAVGRKPAHLTAQVFVADITAGRNNLPDVYKRQILIRC